MERIMNIESQYLDLLSSLRDAAKADMSAGVRRADRTGVGTSATFGVKLEADMADGFPMLTTKRVHWKSVAEETLFFLRGETDTTSLESRGVNIWKANTSRAFLDSHGLGAYPEGEMGPGYGFQWRHFNGLYWARLDGEESNIGGVDQIAAVQQSLRDDPFGRRHVVSAWNPWQIPQMALPPCHAMFQFFVSVGVGGERTLSVSVYQRSADVFLGVPFNIAGYALILHLMSHTIGYVPGKLVWFGGDVHLYHNHVDQASIQIERTQRPMPSLHIQARKPNVWEYAMEDFHVVGYEPHPAIRAEMAV